MKEGKDSRSARDEEADSDSRLYHTQLMNYVEADISVYILASIDTEHFAITI